MESIKSSRVLSLPTEGDFKRTFRFKLSPTPSLLLLSSERLELLEPLKPLPLPMTKDDVGLMTSSLKLSLIKALTGVSASLNFTSSILDGERLILR